VVTRIDGVPPEQHAAVLSLLRNMLGGHETDLDITVVHTEQGWKVRVAAALPHDGPSLLPAMAREVVYADLAEALSSVLSAGLPRPR
jgi:hypothetical protein